MPDPKKKLASKTTVKDTIKSSIQKSFPKATVSKRKNTINDYSLIKGQGQVTMNRTPSTKKELSFAESINKALKKGDSISKAGSRKK